MTTTNDTTNNKMTDAEIEQQAGINYDGLNALEQGPTMMIVHGDGELFEWRKGMQDND